MQELIEQFGPWKVHLLTVLKKYSRWTGAINKTIRDGIDTSGKAARVYKASTQPSISDIILGFGLKKRKAPKRRRGGALMPAGIP